MAFSLSDVNKPGQGMAQVKIDDIIIFDSVLTQTQINLLKEM